jgi:cytochrome c peroxidase
LAHIAIGERLFLETRFSQYFFAHSKGDANANLPAGDPVVAAINTVKEPLPGPFRGFAINCRSCHLVNEFFSGGPGNRTYADFARRSPVPAREDGKTQTARNSPPMVNATIPRESSFLLHFDGEFGSNEDLIKGTMTGRNFGWLPGEQATALQHIAHVIRHDDGRGPLAADFGGYSYRRVFAGGDPELGEEGDRFHLPEEYRLDVSQANDTAIVAHVARLVSTYMDSLFFSRDENAEYDSAPYDWFLETNQVPRKPDSGQSVVYYNRNVLDLVSSSAPFRFTRPGEMRFKTLTQSFQFGPQELLGMKIFFTMARYATNSTRRPPPPHGIGNCVTCHPGPDFTDFKFHNTGAAQEEYDALHGAGAFAELRVPDLPERNAHFDVYLPATSRHPQAAGPFLDVPAKERPGRTDLGLWNVFANPDLAGVQPALRSLLASEGRPLPDAVLLSQTLGLFKTPSLRGLTFSEPYLHTGRQDTLEDVLQFYIRMSALARAGKVRNAAPELSGIFLKDQDIAPLAAFLRALNEDYE